jgi:hypothetical protein
MYKDKAFHAEVVAVREALRLGKDRDVPEAGRYATMSFADFRKEFLGMDTFRHQQAWIDVLEGRDYEPIPGEKLTIGSNRNRVLINTPPFHCAEVSTPVLTANRGWTTVGDIAEDDELYGVDGGSHVIAETWEPEGEVDLFTVRFNTGDEITTDAGHLWHVEGTSGQPKMVSTAWLLENPRYSGRIKWRVPMAPPVEADEADLPLDPYLLGYWLGDGDSTEARVSVSTDDIDPLLAHLDSLGLTYKVRIDSRGGKCRVVYIHKIRHLLPLGQEKRIPAAYMAASPAQRLAMLQGLMDTDGSITPKDGRAYFAQTKDGLALDVYRLAASLGLQPRWKKEKQNPIAPNGKPRDGLVNRIYFKPNGDPVFRLERKARRQRVTAKRCRTNYRVIDSVTPAGRGRVKCISVTSPGNLYLIGDGLIPTHNAKSMTITIDYTTYRICMNPNVRIIIVSKTQAQAKKFLYAVKKRLTDRKWTRLQAVFAPEGGFKGTGEWSANKIYVGHADSDEKDPTVEALGIGGQIYGARADLIILDDVADVGNAHEFEKQINWLDQDVDSRLYDGKLLVVGTRVGTQDIYSELMNDERYLDGTSPWTHLAQPAVLHFADDPKDWVTLWPRATRPLDEASGETPGDDGMYRAWDGERLKSIRSSRSAKIWALVYQQQTATSEDQTFKPVCVWGSVSRRRKPGPLAAGAWGHPRNGGQGMYTIASMDPAMTGDTFTLVGKVDRTENRRFIENCWVQPTPSPTYIRETIKRVTDEYGVNEWVIEKNAFQVFLTTDPEINAFLASRGVKLTPHYTSKNKMDPDFGVASVAPLFGSTRRIHEGAGREVFNSDNLLELPDPDYSQGVKTLVEELLLWVPGKRGKDLRQDGPMALWFFELRARVMLGYGREQGQAAQTHMKIPFMSRGRASMRATPPPPLRGMRRFNEETNV